MGSCPGHKRCPVLGEQRKPYARIELFAFCGGFRLPECKSIHALRQPAAEKRQGTKSREVEHRRGSGRYGDLMLVPSAKVDLISAECSRRVCVLGPEAGDGGLGKCFEQINELRLRLARRLGREGSLPAWDQRV